MSKPMQHSVFGAGTMSRRVNDYDWAATSLGKIEAWPPELKMIVRHILESQFPAAVVWGPQLITIYNDAFLPILGNKPEALGRCFAEVWAEVWDEIGPLSDRAFAGEATYIEDFPLQIDRNGTPEQAWFTFCYSPLRLSDGTVAGMLDTVIETTKSVRAREDLALVNEELNHRLKNTIAIVQSIATQTLGDVQPQTQVTAFRERLAALARAHDALLGQDLKVVSLERVIRHTLDPLDGLSQISRHGPDAEIGSRASLSLALILHELGTNAAKYGALSVPDGSVSLTWKMQDGNLHLSWRENAGPDVVAPTRKGFGSRLIDRGLGSRSQVSRRFCAHGFELDLEVPEAELAN